MIIHSPADIQQWAASLISPPYTPKTIALCGDLGVGKTEAVRGLARKLSCPHDISSPSFAIVHEYLDGSYPLFHFDFYRLKNIQDVLSIGWDDFISSPAIIVVEWADLFPKLMPPSTHWFQISIQSDFSTRLIQPLDPNSLIQ
jgi:tRNA threonylcarbamoyladenosine biosynthesis protein TsaE